MNKQFHRLAIAACVAWATSAFAESQMSKTSEGIVVSVDSGETKSWSELFEASGLTSADCAGQKLIKTGEGTFDVGGSGPTDVGIAGVEIRDGRYQASADNEFGTKNNKNVSVANKATLVLDGAAIASRTVTLASEGTSREYPAVRIESINSDLVNGLTLNIADDAAFYSAVKGNAYFFHYATPTVDGHTLTLDGVNGCIYRFAYFGAWKGGGTVKVAAGVTISSTANNGVWIYRVSDNNYPLFDFDENAALKPDNADVFGLIRRASFAPGCAITPKSGSATVCTFNELTGTPTVSADAAELIVSNSFAIIESDVLASRALTVTGALTFGPLCTFSIPDLGANLVKIAQGTGLTIATAATITGTPALDATVARFFDIVNTGTELKLVRKADQGPVVFLGADWGCLPGEENAAANAAAVQSHLAGLADSTLVLIESDDYWFENGFDVSALTAKGVTVAGINQVDPAVFHSPVTVGAAEGFSLEAVVIRGTTGPAVVATGTQGLAIRDCVLSGVVGTWTDGKAYPYVFTDVADLLVTGCGHSDALSPAWAASACLSGGSQLPLSEVQAGAFVVNVGAGVSKKWAVAVADSGLADGALVGLRLIKIGAGELYSTDTDKESPITASGISNVVIRVGRYSLVHDNGFGVSKGGVTVEEGATLVLRGGWKNIGSRRVELFGMGSSREYPTVRVQDYPGGIVDGATWSLNSDVMFYHAKKAGATSVCAIFNYTHVYGNGHTLTLDGVDGAAYQIKSGAFWHDGGTCVVKEGICLQAATNVTGETSWTYGVYGDPAPLFVFKSGSSFEHDKTDIFKLIKRMSFEESTSFTPKGATDIVLDELTGAPTLDVNVSSLTINKLYAVRKVDVLADRYLDCPGALAFGANAAVGADDATGLEDKVAFHAVGGITGSPKRADSLKSAHVRVVRKDANTWAFQGCGLLLLVR